MLGCPVQSLLWSRGGPCAWSPSMVLQSSCPVSPWLVRCRLSLSCHGKQAISPSDLTILTGVHALASSPLSPCFAVTQVGTVSLSHTPARLAPAAIVAPPMQIITSLPNLCLGARERSVTHGQRASLANQGQEKSRCRNSINRQSTRECFQKLPGKPIPSRTARPQARPPEGFSPSKWRGRPAVPG